MTKNNQEQFDLDAVGEAIKKISKPDLGFDRKLMIKNRIFAKSEVSVIAYIHDLVKNLALDSNRKVVIKERVFDLIEDAKQRRFFWSSFFVFQKKFASAMILLFVLFGMFNFVNIDVGVVMAETFTTLDSFSGDVTVERGDDVISAYAGMSVYEQDRIITGSDGLASVKYFDDSISRLAQNTEIVVNKLFRPVQSSVQSFVQISVINGSVWSRVVNLIESKSSFVVQAMDVTAEAQKAAFNVAVDNEDVKVDVFNYVVDVRTSDKTERVVSGESAVLGAYEKQVVVKDMDESEKSSQWVHENLISDEEYLDEVEQRLFAAKIKSLGFDSEDEVAIVGNSLQENALLLLTFNDVKKKKIELDLAEKNFISAGVKLSDLTVTEEDKIKAEDAIKTFSDSVNDFYVFVDEVGVTDSAYAEELRLYADDKILSQKKNLSLILPDSPVYEAKMVVDELELLAAKDDEELIQVKHDQGVSKLAAAEDVIERGDYELASKVIDESKSDFGDVADMVTALDDGGVKDELFLKMDKDLDLLGKIEDKSVVANESVIAGVAKNEVVSVPATSDVAVSDSGEGGATAESYVDAEAVEVVEPFVVPEETYGIKFEGDKPLPPGVSF